MCVKYEQTIPVIKNKVNNGKNKINTIADINLAKKELEWFPIYDLKEGLKKIQNF